MEEKGWVRKVFFSSSLSRQRIRFEQINFSRIFISSKSTYFNPFPFTHSRWMGLFFFIWCLLGHFVKNIIATARFLFFLSLKYIKAPFWSFFRYSRDGGCEWYARNLDTMLLKILSLAKFSTILYNRVRLEYLISVLEKLYLAILKWLIC